VEDDLLAACSTTGDPLSGPPTPSADSVPSRKCTGVRGARARALRDRTKRQGEQSLLLIPDLSMYSATRASPRVVLRKTLQCYDLTGNNSHRAVVCFDAGLPAFFSLDDGSSQVTMEATSYKREVASSDFELPYPLTETP